MINIKREAFLYKRIKIKPIVKLYYYLLRKKL